MRYYLSRDGAKSADDILLAAYRLIPSVGAGSAVSGTVTLVIPAATPPSTYFVLACADGFNTVVETDEANNCRASATAMTVTP